MKLWDFFKPALFNFDAEKIHEMTLKGLVNAGKYSPLSLRLLSGTKTKNESDEFISFVAKKLYSPVGLAAGFDKNAILLPYLEQLGFSFAEIGSVTLRAQEGNPKPRLFRGEELLFNRMGFNNDGAETIAKRIESYSLSDNFALGINIGLNKETLHSEAASEYLESFKILFPYGDYFVVNVSSPNTPGLRDLQQIGETEKIFRALKSYKTAKPVYLKLAPELDQDSREIFYKRSAEIGIDGFVLTNTLKGERAGLVGGWSGKSLTELSRTILAHASQYSKVPLISVGGIMNIAEALERKKLGANLIQIYTGWVFRGPRFPNQIKNAWFKT